MVFVRGRGSVGGPYASAGVLQNAEPPPSSYAPGADSPLVTLAQQRNVHGVAPGVVRLRDG
jgi:hypothetical protein